jgi:ATP-binding cassette subfamily B protein
VVKLISRLYEPSAGRVTLDGFDLREYDLSDLRQAIGVVTQEAFLFDGSVFDNIAFGKPDATQDEVVEAAKAAEAHHFISLLPQGYETAIGERGKQLSGGQRQRIAIARAILKNAPILVFDEATSAVDNETEAAIQRSVDRFTRGRTAILIAHRLSTVRNVDCIHVMNQGQIIESGTHEELLAHNGAYAALWRVQTGEATLARAA